MATQILNTALPVLSGFFTWPLALAQVRTDHMNSWHFGTHWGWSHMIFGPLIMVLFWVALIVAIIFAVRWISGRRSDSSDTQKTPIEILRERYARGEIDKEEFEERKRILSE